MAPYRILPVLFILLAASLAAGANEEVLHLWSGREIRFPLNGNWSLTSSHGRVLRSGRGDVRFFLPPLTEGASLDAVLKVDESARLLRFHSPAPLTGIGVSGRDTLPGPLAERLAGLGIADRPPESTSIHFATALPEKPFPGMTVVFSDRRDFPLAIPGEWRSVSLRNTGKPGKLSCLLETGRNEVDLRGTGIAAVFRNDRMVLVILSPDFDAGSIESVLSLKEVLK